MYIIIGNFLINQDKKQTLKAVLGKYRLPYKE